MKPPKLVFHDVDGTRYYVTDSGDIVSGSGEYRRLVPLHVEENIRGILALRAARAEGRKAG